MIEIKERSINVMSVVIGICSNNFCTFLSDGRKIANGRNGIEIVSENTQKIFQINERVLLGAAGWFNADEELLDCIEHIDKETASPRVVKEAVTQYIKKKKSPVLTSRSYIIGGKAKGKFELYKVSYSADKGKISTGDYSPTGKLNYGITVGVPPHLSGECDKIIEQVGKCVIGGGSHETAMRNVEKIIVDISKRDESVNDKVNRLSII